jgi:UDP-N-acetylglucosamine pyrophosphorylase
LNATKTGLNIESRGTGAVLNALIKYDVFRTWKTQNVKYVNICDTNNINNTFSDPFNLAFMISNNLECTIDVT